MIGAGTVINPLIKIITTVVILGAVYLFIVKPALDTTNNAFDSFSDSFNGFDNLPTSPPRSTALRTRHRHINVGAAGLHHARSTPAQPEQIDRCLKRFGP